MAIIDDIIRDYPYQVTLSFDDDAAGVLDWLDARLGHWDMYVDLKQQTVRYCFREPAEAFAFSRRFVKVREAGVGAARP